MVELQSVAHDNRMSRLNSRDPNDSDKPNTNSTLPIQMHPGHGNY